MFRDLPIPYAQARWSPADRWVATRHGDEVAVHAVDDAREAFTLEGRPARGLHWLSDDALCLWFMDSSERPTARFEVIAVPDGGRVDAWAVDDVAAIESWSTSRGDDVALLRVRRPDGPRGVRWASVVVSLRRGAVVRVPTDVGRPRRVLVERSPAGRHVAVSFIHKRGINFGGEVHRWMTWFDASLLP